MSNTYASGEQTKRNILNESKKLFYRQGYKETTYSDICKAANINRALIPYHFNSKQILGLEIYHQIMTEFYSLIDNTLNSAQFDTDFINILHMITYYRLLADNPSFLKFVSELQSENNATLFTLEEEQKWIAGLGTRFTNLNVNELTMLSQMHIGMHKESISLLDKADNHTDSDTISKVQLHMLMRYVGYSTKKIDELTEAAIAVANLLNFQIQTDFSIKLTYN